MKKSLGALAAIAAAALSLTPAQTQAHNNIQTEQAPQRQQPKQLPQRVHQRPISINPAYLGDYRLFFQNEGISPKTYGQYLQASGKQKWIKKRKRH